MRWEYKEYRIRRCTGLRPSRASGSARATITLKAYERKEERNSSETETSCTCETEAIFEAVLTRRFPLTEDEGGEREAIF
jgi:hypothetical protein